MPVWNKAFAGCCIASLILLVDFDVSCMFNSTALNAGLLASAYSSSGNVSLQLSSQQCKLLMIYSRKVISDFDLFATVLNFFKKSDKHGLMLGAMAKAVSKMI